MIWRLFRNLQASLEDFLKAQALSDGLVDIHGNSINFRVGRKDATWTLSTISYYVDSETAPRMEIGSNKRDKRQLMIIDIFAENEVDRVDLANWVADTINDGWRYYTYTGNSSNPGSPTKVAGGLVNVNFLTNLRVALGTNVVKLDAHRHRISISVWIS